MLSTPEGPFTNVEQLNERIQKIQDTSTPFEVVHHRKRKSVTITPALRPEEKPEPTEAAVRVWNLSDQVNLDLDHVATRGIRRFLVQGHDGIPIEIGTDGGILLPESPQYSSLYQDLLEKQLLELQSRQAANPLDKRLEALSRQIEALSKAVEALQRSLPTPSDKPAETP